MHDERAEAPQPQQERAPWVEPVVARLSAGSAEIEIGPADDGVDKS